MGITHIAHKRGVLDYLLYRSRLSPWAWVGAGAASLWFSAHFTHVAGTASFTESTRMRACAATRSLPLARGGAG